MKKNIALLSLLLTLASPVYAAKNTIFVELGGNAAIYSINYERFFEESWGIRVGIGALWDSENTVALVPLLFNKYWGNQNSPHKFETGLGATFGHHHERDRYWGHNYHNIHQGVMGTATLGYRYLPKEKGMTFKFAFTPFFDQDTFIPWVGISLGYAF